MHDLMDRSGARVTARRLLADQERLESRRGVHRVLGVILLTTVVLAPGLVRANDDDSGLPSGSDRVLFDIDFTNADGLPTLEWLQMNEFELHHHADDPGRIEFHHDDEKLNVVVKRPAFGLAIRPVEAPTARRLRLHWGVADFPEGASYEHGVDNEAIMVYVFFGDERLPSGEMFVPDSPYFIGFYLCPAGGDDVEVPYVGHHYEKTGRYVCVDHPGEGRAVVSEVDLPEEFANSFGIDTMPPVSALSIEVDTTDSGNDGHAAAFLERLEFLGGND